MRNGKLKVLMPLNKKAIGIIYKSIYLDKNSFNLLPHLALVSINLPIGLLPTLPLKVVPTQIDEEPNVLFGKNI